MTEIFVPMFYMMCLTATVFLFSTGIRLKEIYLTSSDASVDEEEHPHPPFDNGSVVLRNFQRNLTISLSFQFCFPSSAFQYL
jgi:hypothetical protein